MKITKKVKGIILAGVVTISVGVAVSTIGLGGVNVASTALQVTGHIDPPGD